MSSTAQIIVGPELTHAQGVIGERVSVLLLRHHQSAVSTDKTDAGIIANTEIKDALCH